MRDTPTRVANYREYATRQELRSHVACSWTLRVGAEGSDPLAVIPDGCVDIIIPGDGPIFVAGPASETQWVAPQAGAQFTGIRLKPGAARALFRDPLDTLLNRDVELRTLCGRAVQPLLPLTHGAMGSDELRRSLERWVGARIDERGSAALAVLHVSRALTYDAGSSLSALMLELGWSARRLHREVTASCGYGPKLLQRIMRIQRTLRLARTQPASARLSALAANAGFADQAHMTREFRALIGLTPARYLAGGHPEAGQWLDDPY
jgi:AraC-like DNA-binding protein